MRLTVITVNPHCHNSEDGELTGITVTFTVITVRLTVITVRLTVITVRLTVITVSSLL